MDPIPPMPLVTETPSRSGLTCGLPGVGPGLPRGDQRELLAAVHPAGLHAADGLGGVGRGGARDPDREILGPVVGQCLHAAAAGEHR